MTGFLGQGPDTVRIWPVVQGEDERGNIVRRPATDSQAVSLQCWVYPNGDTSDGQALYEVINPDLPTGPWGKAAWDGREWDIVGEVEKYNAFNVKVAKAVIRAREPRPANG